MNDRVNESFSAFLDGEASEVDIQRMMNALDQNPELLDDWHRLSQVQAAMAGDVIVDVANRRQQEAADEAPKPPARKPWLKRVSQIAVAAGVAVIVVVGARWENTSAPATQVAEVPNLEASQARFEAQQRLNSYLRQHAEAASYSSGHAVVPYEPEWEESE